MCETGEHETMVTYLKNVNNPKFTRLMTTKVKINTDNF